MNLTAEGITLLILDRSSVGGWRFETLVFLESCEKSVREYRVKNAIFEE